jgi:hypothetical protein
MTLMPTVAATAPMHGILHYGDRLKLWHVRIVQVASVICGVGCKNDGNINRQRPQNLLSDCVATEYA